MSRSPINPHSTDAQIGVQLEQLAAQQKDIEIIEQFASGVRRIWLVILRPICREMIRMREHTRSLETRINELERLLAEK